MHATSMVHDVLRSPGLSMEPGLRAELEPRFGRNFGEVKIHTDSSAGRSAQALNAQAYTAGRHIVFAPDQYQPGTHAGRHLLAHELTHVAQQEARVREDQIHVQRRPATTGKTIHMMSIPEYEWTGTEQRETSQSKNQSYIYLDFDDSKKELVCTFRLLWRFPEDWSETKRVGYIADFAKAVQNTWQGTFPLVRYENDVATADRATVMIEFDDARAPDMKNNGDESEMQQWLQSPSGAATNTERWIMNVHSSAKFRDNVDTPIVNLDPDSNKPQTNSTADYATKSWSGISPYQHYFDIGITPSKGPAPGGNYTQVASAHEFGHMLGLADEYVLPREDYSKLEKLKGTTAADAELKKRRSASDRIQNIGSKVTKDAYQPFANFMRTVRWGEDWRVQ